LNNKVERKIVGHLSKAVAAIKKQKEDKAKEEQSKSEEKNLDNAETIRKNKQKEMENESI
jgi:hypothetical protein